MTKGTRKRLAAAERRLQPLVGVQIGWTLRRESFAGKVPKGGRVVSDAFLRGRRSGQVLWIEGSEVERLARGPEDEGEIFELWAPAFDKRFKSFMHCLAEHNCPSEHLFGFARARFGFARQRIELRFGGKPRDMRPFEEIGVGIEPLAEGARPNAIDRIDEI